MRFESRFKRLSRSTASSLALYDEIQNELYFEIGIGEKGQQAKPNRIKLGRGVIGRAALSGESQIIENARLYRENMEEERLASLGRGISGAAHCIENVINLVTIRNDCMPIRFRCRCDLRD